MGFPAGSDAKESALMQETQVQSLGWEWLPTPSCLWPQNYVNKAHICIDALGVPFEKEGILLVFVEWWAFLQVAVSLA